MASRGTCLGFKSGCMVQLCNGLIEQRFHPFERKPVLFQELLAKVCHMIREVVDENGSYMQLSAFGGLKPAHGIRQPFPQNKQCLCHCIIGTFYEEGNVF